MAGTISRQPESQGKVAAGLGRCQGHWGTIASCSGRLITAPVLVCGLMGWSGGARGAGDGCVELTTPPVSIQPGCGAFWDHIHAS